jgi:hypothetical protein
VLPVQNIPLLCFEFFLMRYMKWIGLVFAVLLIAACFIPWVTIGSKGITITGVDAAGTNYGKPGYFNLVMTAFFIFFTVMPRVWAKRANLLIVALNVGWAVRNFFILSACQAGECPERETGLFLMLLSSLGMLASALFPDMKVPEKRPT